MSSITYADSTSYVSRSDPNYAPIAQYSQIGNSTNAPMRSVLKLTVAPGSEKYFSVKPEFIHRTDSVRMQPALIPVNLNTSNVNTSASTNDASAKLEMAAAATSYDYSSPY